MSEPTPGPATRAEPDLRGTKREVFAWAMYDWASSAYSTISITVLVTYLTSTVDGVYPGRELGAPVWAWGIGLSMFISALVSPILGAVADAQSSKRAWLAITGLGGAIASCGMFLATPERPWLLVGLFFVAHFASEVSLTFYNGFLPEIAGDEEMGRVSAWGYILGYLGGGLALLVVLMLIQQGWRLGLPTLKEDTSALLPRLSLLLMGVWWGVFMLPTLLWLRDRRPVTTNRPAVLTAVGRAVRDVGTTLRNIRRYRTLAIFLVSFLVFNDGVQTVISQASVFADKVLKMELSELVQVILLIQFVAMPGAWLVGHLADRVGQKPVLVACLAIWTVLLVAAFFVTTKLHFWLLAVVVALVLGGTQSVSRAIMGLMTPEAHTAEFFGFFNLSGKATSVLGPMFFGTIMYLSGSAHWALASLLAFFVIGWALLMPVNVDRGRRKARSEAAPRN